MIKVIVFTILIAVVVAKPQHGGGHAVSHQTVTHITQPVAHGISYAAAPAVAYHAAPAVAYHAAAPAAVTYHAAAPAFAYHAAPALAYHTPAVTYHAAAPAVAYHAAPAIAVKAAPIAVKAVEVEHVAPAHYEFEYGVNDPHTGDIKEQKESRKDDVVQGYYSLHEADGTKRTVHYTADKHSGFNAVVHREGKAVHAQPVKAAPALIKAAPIVSYAAPLTHGYLSH